MNSQPNYTLVGLFVVLLAAAMVAGGLWISMAAPYRDFERYLVHMRDSVSGLSENALVKYRGVDVGRVADIGLDPQHPQRVRVLIEVVPQTPIRQDTVARLEMQGLTGLGYINLTGSSADAPLLRAEAGAPYPVIEGEASLLANAEDRAGRLLSQVTEVTERLNALLSNQNQRAISDTLQQLQALAAGMGSAISDLQATMANTRQASAAMPNLMRQVEQSVAALETMGNELAQTGTVLAETARTSGEEVQRFMSQTLPEVQAMISELRRTAENLRRTSQQIERNPSVLLRGSDRQPGPGE